MGYWGGAAASTNPSRQSNILFVHADNQQTQLNSIPTTHTRKRKRKAPIVHQASQQQLPAYELVGDARDLHLAGLFHVLPPQEPGEFREIGGSAADEKKLLAVSNSAKPYPSVVHACISISQLSTYTLFAISNSTKPDPSVFHARVGQSRPAKAFLSQTNSGAPLPLRPPRRVPGTSRSKGWESPERPRGYSFPRPFTHRPNHGDVLSQSVGRPLQTMTLEASHSGSLTFPLSIRGHTEIPHRTPKVRFNKHVNINLR